jgi:hypothetical protein
VTYFGVFNFGTSYLVAKIGQNKTMTEISRFTVSHVYSLKVSGKTSEKQSKRGYEEKRDRKLLEIWEKDQTWH